MASSPNFSRVDDSTLKHGDEDSDLHDVVEAVLPLCAHWYDLGLAFRIKPSSLDTIKATEPDPKKRLNTLMSKWLSKEYNFNKFGNPSWKLLCAAVHSPVGGNNPALAEKIANNHLAVAAVTRASGSPTTTNSSTPGSSGSSTTTTSSTPGSSGSSTTTTSSTPGPSGSSATTPGSSQNKVEHDVGYGHLLDPEDSSDLLATIRSAASQWRDIGRHLGFKDKELNNMIPKNNTPVDYLEEMLEQWLNWAPPLKSYTYTEDLVEALRAAKLEKLAHALENNERFMKKENYKQIERTTPSTAHGAATREHTDGNGSGSTAAQWTKIPDGNRPKAVPQQACRENPEEKKSKDVFSLRQALRHKRCKDYVETLAEVEEKASRWCQSLVKPGQFTGAQLVRPMSMKEHQMGHQAWVTKSMFRDLSGEFGMKMLKKMGWEEG